jgi:hypothetical protein
MSIAYRMGLGNSMACIQFQDSVIIFSFKFQFGVLLPSFKLDRVYMQLFGLSTLYALNIKCDNGIVHTIGHELCFC